MQVLARCAVDGLGIAPGPTMAVGRYLASGELLRVLPEYEFQPVAVFAVYLSGCKTSTKVRSLVGFLEQRLHDPPPWDQVLLQRGLLPDKYGQVL
jgi:DNA-binding transcriptional LysR family regulator